MKQNANNQNLLSHFVQLLFIFTHLFTQLLIGTLTTKNHPRVATNTIFKKTFTNKLLTWHNFS